MRRTALILLMCPVFALAARNQPCIATDQASSLVNKDICIEAHVYEVVELPTGRAFSMYARLKRLMPNANSLSSACARIEPRSANCGSIAMPTCIFAGLSSRCMAEAA